MNGYETDRNLQAGSWPEDEAGYPFLSRLQRDIEDQVRELARHRQLEPQKIFFREAAITEPENGLRLPDVPIVIADCRRSDLPEPSGVSGMFTDNPEDFPQRYITLEIDDEVIGTLEPLFAFRLPEPWHSILENGTPADIEARDRDGRTPVAVVILDRFRYATMAHYGTVYLPEGFERVVSGGRLMTGGELYFAERERFIAEKRRLEAEETRNQAIAEAQKRILDITLPVENEEYWVEPMKHPEQSNAYFGNLYYHLDSLSDTPHPHRFTAEIGLPGLRAVVERHLGSYRRKEVLTGSVTIQLYPITLATDPDRHITLSRIVVPKQAATVRGRLILTVGVDGWKSPVNVTARVERERQDDGLRQFVPDTNTDASPFATCEAAARILMRLTPEQDPPEPSGDISRKPAGSEKQNSRRDNGRKIIPQPDRNAHPRRRSRTHYHGR